jgi:hypothetical protein
MIWNKKELALMENLRKQYDENLTQEQKNSLIRYNSSLFVFFNKIVSIDGYESKSIDELYLAMKPFIDQYSYIIKNLTLFMSANDSDEDLKEIFSSIIDEDVMVYDLMIERTGNPYTHEIYDRIPEEYTIHEMLRILVEDGVISSENYNIDDIVSCRKVLYSVLYTEYCKAEKKFNILTADRLEKIYKKFIGNLLKDVKIIKSIPEESIVLPEDVTVYRGVRTDDEINSEILSTSDFVSTSLSKDVASQYITRREGNNNLLLSIKLSNGTPVFVFPQTVKNDGFWAQNLFLSEDDRIFEIMFDKTKVKNVEILAAESLENSKSR